MRKFIWLIGSIIVLLALLGGIHYFSWRSKLPRSVVLDTSVYPVKGIDLSSHNGDVDFHRLVADSLDFIMLKASEGTTFQDTKFHSNYVNARKAGIKAIGAYHFFRFDTDGQMQAMNFLNSLRGKMLDLPAVIDIEEWGNPKHIPDDDIIERLSALLDYLHQNGHNVMFYTNKDGYERFIKGRFNDYPLWICSFSDPPLEKEDAGRWSLWQYSHLGWTEACDSEVDLNTFNGTREEWIKWLGGSTF